VEVSASQIVHKAVPVHGTTQRNRHIQWKLDASIDLPTMGVLARHLQDPKHLCAAKEGDLCKCYGRVFFGRKFRASRQPGSGAITTFEEMLAYNKYSSKRVSGTIRCRSIDFSEDPDRNYYKHCYCVTKAMLKDSHSGATYHSKASLCAANENDNCKCDGTVYFARKFASDKKPGAGSVNTFQEMIDYDKYLFRNVSGILPCKSKSFGGDPDKGRFKHCYCVPQSRTGPGANSVQQDLQQERRELARQQRQLAEVMEGMARKLRQNAADLEAKDVVLADETQTSANESMSLPTLLARLALTMGSIYFWVFIRAFISGEPSESCDCKESKHCQEALVPTLLGEDFAEPPEEETLSEDDAEQSEVGVEAGLTSLDDDRSDTGLHGIDARQTAAYGNVDSRDADGVLFQLAEPETLEGGIDVRSDNDVYEEDDGCWDFVQVSGVEPLRQEFDTMEGA